MFLITSKEKFTKLSFCLLCFMGVRFGAYEKTYSTDSVASISVLFVACVVSAFELELIQTQMAQKPMLRAEVGMRMRCANKASAE